jgi:hypothetical protein
MRLVLGAAERGPIAASATVLAALTTLSFAVFSGLPVMKVAPMVALVVTAAVAYRALLAWRTQLAAVVLVILLIPIRRYTLPVNLPFQLEPYRILVALVAGAWLSSMLIDPRVRLRRTLLEPPLFALVLVILGSVALNGGRIQQLGVGVIVVKRITFLVSFLIVVYLIASVVRRPDHRDFIVRVLVGGGTFVAVAALFEARTHVNIFNHLDKFIPLLRLSHGDVATTLDLARGGRQRVYASAQHPIALGAALTMLVPLGIYLGRLTGRRRWWIATVVLAFGSLASLSRTAIVMYLVLAVVYIRHRPKQVKRLVPALIPMLAVLHVAVPGAIGTIADSFHPKGGLAKEQSVHAGTSAGGRIVKAKQAIGEWKYEALIGQGYGTRVVDIGPKLNAIVLDDGWLDILLETGFFGTCVWIWLFSRFCRRMGRSAKGDDSPRGWLLTAVTASVAAYAFGMLTYDAMSFIQVTLIMFIMLGLGAATLMMPDGASLRAKAAR